MILILVLRHSISFFLSSLPHPWSGTCYQFHQHETRILRTRWLLLMDLVDWCHVTGNTVWVASRFMWHLLWWAGTLREIVTWSCEKQGLEGFPGSSVVSNSPASAADTGLIPDPGRSHVLWQNYAHAPQLLGLCSRSWEPQPLRPDSLELVLSNKESPCTTTREQPSLAAAREKFAQQWRPSRT